MSGSTISTLWVQRVLAAAERAGVPIVRVRSEIGLSESAPEGAIHRDVLFDVWERLVAISRNRALPMEMATRASPDHPDVLVLACATCSTLLDAMERLSKFLGQWTQSISVEVQRKRDGTIFVAFRRAEPSSRLGAALADEFVLADALNMILWFTGARCVPLGVSFTHAAPKPLSPYRAYFRAPLSFDAPRCGMSFSAESVSVPLLRRDPWIAAFAERAARGSGADLSAMGSSTIERVRSQIRALLGDTVPSANVIARRLAWSARTLRRRLTDEGTSYRDVLDDVRRDEALRHVGESDRSLSEIAASLGFSHPSTFHRAFVRWAGVPPSRYRRARRGPASEGASS